MKGSCIVAEKNVQVSAQRKKKHGGVCDVMEVRYENERAGSIVREILEWLPFKDKLIQQALESCKTPLGAMKITR